MNCKMKTHHLHATFVLVSRSVEIVRANLEVVSNTPRPRAVCYVNLEGWWVSGRKLETARDGRLSSSPRFSRKVKSRAKTAQTREVLFRR